MPRSKVVKPTTPAPPSSLTLKCENPNCPAEGPRELFKKNVKAKLTLCRTCGDYYCINGKFRSKKLCDRHPRPIRPSMGIGYSNADNLIIYDNLESLVAGPTDPDALRAAEELSTRLSLGNGGATRVFDHIASSSFLTWKAIHDERLSALDKPKKKKSRRSVSSKKIKEA